MSPYQSRVIRQTMLWVNGISEHNRVEDECCPDFSCCHPECFDTDQARRVDYFTKLVKRAAAESKKGGPRRAA